MSEMPNGVSQLEAIHRLRKDLKDATKLIGRREARYLVDAYYQIQEMRKASGNQIRSVTPKGEEERPVEPLEPHAILDWYNTNTELLENSLKKALSWYADSKPLGVWAQSIHGIGPVISAGLLAHIDFNPWRCLNKDAKKKCKSDAPCSEFCHFEKITTVGQIWSFAGLSVGQEWHKGERRPWNAQLKTLCWKIGDCFMKTYNSEKSFYGKIFAERWELEKQRNEQNQFADQAKVKLEKFNIRKSTDAYKSYSTGKLPPAHILARAERYTVKLFLSHYHAVGYEMQFGEKPPKPFVVEHLGHAHVIPPPNWPMP